ncbi:MAG: BON domain-containing protein [Dehalococcoidia bacterium]
MHDFLLPNSRTARFLASRRHPDQAALLARLPLLGRRIPMRGYWRRQPIDASRMTQHAASDVADALRAAGFSAGMGTRSMLERRAANFTDRHEHRHVNDGEHDGLHFGEMTRDRARRAGDVWKSRPRLGLPMLIVGTAVGALAMFAFDPQQGRRRRALVRDRLAHMKNVMTRDVPNRVEKRGRFFRGVARGIVHETTDALPFNGHPIVDNETLVARVRSEALRDDHLKAGEIHVDAYEGCVTLRGQLEHPDAIRRLVRDAAHVEGVREVRNFLHLPGTPPPNKAAVYVPAQQVPSTMRR